MPPCTWMPRSAHEVTRRRGQGGRDGRGEALLAAAWRGVRAASHTAAVASSVATSMLAQWCLTAWNIPIGRPNCSRTSA